MSQGHASLEQSIEYVNKHGINIQSDIATLDACPEDMMVLLRTLDDRTTSEHCTQTGADYHFSQLDYLTDQGRSKCASRYIATILGGRRTELAYWADEAPQKKLTVHQGVGRLVVGSALDGDTNTFRLDPEVTPEIVLPSGRFYTFVADIRTPKPLVVSGFYKEEFDWDDYEKCIEPGQGVVECGGKIIEVPFSFSSRYE